MWQTKRAVLVEKSPQSMVKISALSQVFGENSTVKFVVLIKVIDKRIMPKAFLKRRCFYYIVAPCDH